METENQTTTHTQGKHIFPLTTWENQNHAESLGCLSYLSSQRFLTPPWYNGAKQNSVCAAQSIEQWHFPRCSWIIRRPPCRRFSWGPFFFLFSTKWLQIKTVYGEVCGFSTVMGTQILDIDVYFFLYFEFLFDSYSREMTGNEGERCDEGLCLHQMFSILNLRYASLYWHSKTPQQRKQTKITVLYCIIHCITAVTDNNFNIVIWLPYTFGNAGPWWNVCFVSEL